MIVCPTTDGSLLNADRQVRSLRTVRLGPPTTSSSPANSRPIAGGTPRTRKYPALTRCGVTLIVRDPATRLTGDDSPAWVWTAASMLGDCVFNACQPAPVTDILLRSTSAPFRV